MTPWFIPWFFFSRKFVVSELSHCSGQVPERHDLTLFPTVNDLKNHIHQAFKDMQAGILPLNQQNPVVSWNKLIMIEGIYLVVVHVWSDLQFIIIFAS